MTVMETRKNNKRRKQGRCKRKRKKKRTKRRLKDKRRKRGKKKDIAIEKTDQAESLTTNYNIFSRLPIQNVTNFF